MSLTINPNRIGKAQQSESLSVPPTRVPPNRRLRSLLVQQLAVLGQRPGPEDQEQIIGITVHSLDAFRLVLQALHPLPNT